MKDAVAAFDLLVGRLTSELIRFVSMTRRRRGRFENRRFHNLESVAADLKEIFGRLGKTVVLVTHDMGEAAYLGDRIVLMREGRVVQEGTLAEFQNRPREPYVTEFLNAQRAVVAL